MMHRPDPSCRATSCVRRSEILCLIPVSCEIELEKYLLCYLRNRRIRDCNKVIARGIGCGTLFAIDLYCWNANGNGINNKYVLRK